MVQNDEMMEQLFYLSILTASVCALYVHRMPVVNQSDLHIVINHSGIRTEPKQNNGRPNSNRQQGMTSEHISTIISFGEQDKSCMHFWTIIKRPVTYIVQCFIVYLNVGFNNQYLIQTTYMTFNDSTIAIIFLKNKNYFLCQTFTMYILN